MPESLGVIDPRLNPELLSQDLLMTPRILVCVRAHAHVWRWRLEVDIVCLLLSMHLSFEGRVFH